MVSAISFFSFQRKTLYFLYHLSLRFFVSNGRLCFCTVPSYESNTFPSEDLIVYLLFLIIFPQILCTQFLENFSIDISHRWLDVNERDFIHFWQYSCRHFQYQFIGYVVDFDDLFSATTCIKSETIRHMNMKLSG